MERLKFTYGFTTKTVHGKEYVYFWQYTGTGRKSELYMGPGGKLKTQRKALTTKLKYLEGLEQELSEMIKQTSQELEVLRNTPDEGKNGHGKDRGRRTTAKGAINGPVDGSRDQRDEEEKTQS